MWDPAHNPKPHIVVMLVRIVIVAVRAAHVPLIIVERPATQHGALQPAPSAGNRQTASREELRFSPALPSATYLLSFA
jgi:hypothetical protein